VSSDSRLGGPRTNRTHTRRRARSARVPMALAALLVLGGCSGRDLALPTGATDRGDYVATLWFGAWLAAGVVGVFVFGLMVWAVIRYRRRPGDEAPPQIRYNLPIEVLYTVAPLIVVAVFFYHTVDYDERIYQTTGNPEHEVVVLGQRWSWTFSYVEEEAVGGESVYTSGTPADRPVLVLPVGETVTFELRSQDVIHAFWVPAFYFKQDVVPGRDSEFTITPTREGTYAGRCSELCGVYHTRMLFTVEIVSPEEYDAYLQDLQASGNVGIVAPSSETTVIAGTEDEEPSPSEEGATP